MDKKAKVRRRVLACKKRKLACDGKVPSCTRCVDATVPCVGFDSSTQREAPRSIAAFLEAHIAILENPSSPTFRRPTRPASTISSPATSYESESHNHYVTERCTHADRLVNQIMEDITPSFLGISKVKPILNCVVRGAQLPSRKGPVGATDLNENHPRSIINPQPTWTGLEAIDVKTAEGLLHNFLDRVLTLYPIYHRNEVESAFRHIYYPTSNQEQDSPRHRYIISIVMAISLSTAGRTNQLVANSHAYSLVQHAIQWIPDVATNDLAGLQAILLLTQYSFLNPTMADVWLLTGLISQAVIDLGLHQELPYDTRISAYDRDKRRRLFWVAWEMEVAVCSIFLRPINLPTRRYDVNFPVEVDDTGITTQGIDLTAKVSKFTSKKIWLFRQIEAEVVSVMHQNEPIPAECTSLQQWMHKIETSMLEWQRQIYDDASANKDPAFESRWNEMKLYSDIAQPYILVTMYRPSRRIPQPTTEHLITAFENAVKVADNYWKQSNTEDGNIKYVFHPCHHSFDSAIVFLQGLQRCKVEISERYSLEQIGDWMGRFSRFFATIAERWPAATRCLDEYVRLLTPIKKEYEEFLVQKANYFQKPVHGSFSYPGATDFEDAFSSVTAFNPITASNSIDPLEAYAVDMPRVDWTQFSLDYGLHGV
ncbi:GAL4-like transcription factor-like protein [Dendryphion nanum]|uniref:GAL4-like transcription factor-like protein n=1 Tax=Dendryphion nanum TaxID=256645 RepID=A0A9P9IFC5_9PLEO|nr:GAL4-like transcription factor-like protein [Dendryphion nanum]